MPNTNQFSEGLHTLTPLNTTLFTYIYTIYMCLTHCVTYLDKTAGSDDKIGPYRRLFSWSRASGTNLHLYVVVMVTVVVLVLVVAVFVLACGVCSWNVCSVPGNRQQASGTAYTRL